MGYNILWIDDDVEFLACVRLSFKGRYNILTASHLAEALTVLKSEVVDLVLLDVSLGDEDGLEGITQIKRECSSVDVVMVTGEREPKVVVQAIKKGASDYLCKPIDTDELAALVEKLQATKQIRDRYEALLADLNPEEARSHFIGTSPAFRAMLNQADRLKGHQANILLAGESGTGKELLARYIHGLEDDPRRPFIAVNCAAIPEGLIESELFGHEKGSFTGAHQRKIGKFEQACGGDIFLDEISALRLDLQAKILRVLQEKEVVRVGGNTPIKVDARVISATNDLLEDLVARGEFRMDLYHRLRVIQLRIVPLRDRKEDIPMLIAYFLDKFGKTKGAKKITAAALRRLQNYSWPGNVRELENVVHSLLILTPDEVIGEEHLPQWALTGMREPGSLSPQLPGMKVNGNGIIPLKDYVRTAERQLIEHALRVHEGDKSQTANALGVGRTTLYGKLRELGMA